MRVSAQAHLLEIIDDVANAFKEAGGASRRIPSHAASLLLGKFLSQRQGRLSLSNGARSEFPRQRSRACIA